MCINIKQRTALQLRPKPDWALSLALFSAQLALALIDHPVPIPQLVNKTKLTKIAFNPIEPIVLVGDDRCGRQGVIYSSSAQILHKQRSQYPFPPLVLTEASFPASNCRQTFANAWRHRRSTDQRRGSPAIRLCKCLGRCPSSLPRRGRCSGRGSLALAARRCPSLPRPLRRWPCPRRRKCAKRGAKPTASSWRGRWRPFGE